ncbi:hypothetical protein BDW22DRAFT_448857 [Trametopsis cervina]|nr:hypothetical protein BDW22DRAFT_448857 [Trametopsis cervina]
MRNISSVRAPLLHLGCTTLSAALFNCHLVSSGHLRAHSVDEHLLRDSIPRGGWGLIGRAVRRTSTSYLRSDRTPLRFCRVQQALALRSTMHFYISCLSVYVCHPACPGIS